MYKATKSLMIFIILLTFSVPLISGVYLEGIESAAHQGQGTTKIYVDADRLRIESISDAQNTLIIFRQDKELFWVLDQNKKTYQEMTKDDLKKMKGKIDESMKMLEEQLKNMPPEQRKMMEEMMPKQAMMNAQKMVKKTYVKKLSNVKVGKWSCTLYQGSAEGEQKEDVWTVDWSQIDIGPEDLTAFQDLGEFFSSLAPDMTDIFEIGTEEFEKSGGYAGMPVKSVEYEGGKIISSFEMKKLEKKSLDRSLFELPQGFTKIDSGLEDM